MCRKKCFIYIVSLCFIFAFLNAQGKSASPEKSEYVSKVTESVKVQKLADLKSLVEKEIPEIITFKETWAYLTAGRENELAKTGNAVTDIGYFGATLDSFGNLVDVPKRENLKANPNQKVHMVIVDTGRALTHFCISRKYPVRNELLRQIAKAAKPYDGVQIDFELVSAQDAEDSYSFLRDLKRRLPKKTSSIEVPARTKRLTKEAYDYAVLSKIVDRIVVMAYDEHWATSRPGPVASLKWCENIMLYSQATITTEKLIMGTPFYGRCWNTDNTPGSYRYTSIERLQNQQKIKEIKRVNDVPSFQLKKEVVYQFYYDDLYSLKKRLKLYADSGEDAAHAVPVWLGVRIA